MKRIIPVVLAVVMLLAILAGCSAASNYPDLDYEESAEFGSSSDSGSNLSSDRKLIRKITVKAETEDMDDLLTQVYARVTELDGYVESRNIQNSSSRYATLVIRIPAENLDAFVEHISGKSNILSMVETSEDVTLEYVDTESQLKVLRAEEERLLTFLEQAETVSEMLEIEKRLTEVRTEIESLTSQLNTYDNLVSYGTVTLRIDEVEAYTEPEEEEPGLLTRMGTGFLNGLKALGAVMEVLLVVLSTILPFLLVPAIVVVAVILIVRRIRRKKKKAAGETK